MPVRVFRLVLTVLTLLAAPTGAMAAAAPDAGDDGAATESLAPVPATIRPLARSTLLNGAARAGERIVAVGQWGHILLSDDDGANWRQVPVPVDVTLTAVRFADDRLGFAVGHDSTVLRTQDGGESWDLVHFDPADGTPLMDIRMTGNGRGFAVGAYGLVLLTADDGRRWTRKDMGDLDWHLNGTDVAPDGRIWIAGEAGNVFVASPDFSQFTAFETGYAGSFWNILCLRDGGVLAFGMRGNIWRSDAAGQSWQPVANPSTASLEAGLVLADGRIVLVGLEGTILVSRDQGQSFTALARADRDGLAAALPRRRGGLLVFGFAGVAGQSLTE